MPTTTRLLGHRATRCHLTRYLWLTLLVVLVGVGATWMLRPFWSDTYMGRGDLVAHLALAASARGEILDGQWLLSFVNNAPVGLQPWFRDYSVFPYLLSVPVQLLGFTTYKALLLLEGALFVVAGLGMFTVCRYFRVHPALALIAGVIYALSPYALDDVLLRGDVPEWTVIALLPTVLYCLLRCYATKGRRCFWPTIFLVAALLLTHKILLPWFFCACAIYLTLLTLAPGPRQGRRWRRLFLRGSQAAVPILLGALLTAPYWLEALVSTGRMLIGGAILNTAYETATQGWVILIPIWRAGPGVEGAGLALKLGAPTTLGLALGLACLRGRCSVWAAGIVGLALALCVAAGSGFWLQLPVLFRAVQFPYRLISLTVLFGALALALSADRLRRAPALATRPRVTRLCGAALLVLALGTTVEFYRGDHGPGQPAGPATALEVPGAIVTYLPPDYLEPAQLGTNPGAVQAAFYNPPAPPGSGRVVVPRDAMTIRGYTGTAQVTVRARSLVILPVAYSSFLQLSVQDGATGHTQPVALVNDSARAAVWLDPGTYTVQVARGFYPPALAAFGLGVLLALGWAVRRQRAWLLNFRRGRR